MKSVTIPSSKSLSNRALILAALSSEATTLYNLLESDDTRYMREALRQLGVRFLQIGKNDWQVHPPKVLHGEDQELFIGNAGTAARFLIALAPLIKGSFILKGIERMHQRPQADLLEVVEFLGVKVEYLGERGFLPVRFTAPEVLKSEKVELSGTKSSQFISALLLAAPRLSSRFEIKVTEPIPSWPYVAMTVELLKLWGVAVEVSDDQQSFIISSGLQSPEKFTIPGDCSSASYPLAWSVLSGQPIRIENFGAQTWQGDEQFLQIIQKSGARVERRGDRVIVYPGAEVLPLGDVDFTTMPDVAMTGMVLAAVAKGTSTFTGLESLRVKECDRIVAMVEGLAKLGVNISVSGNVVKIEGGLSVQNHPQICSYDDHRIAMCFGILRAAKDLSFTIDDESCVAKTWPDFWLALADWQSDLRAVAGVILQRENKFLLVRKPRKNHAWQFPQGGVDARESLSSAAKRELLEECGDDLHVKFRGERPVGEYAYFFPANFARHDSDVRGAKVSFFHAEYLSGEAEVDQQEIVEARWCDVLEIEDLVEPSYWETVRWWLGKH